MTKKIAIFSFFSGVGFLDLGFESADCEIVFVNEIHKPFLEAYKYARCHLNIPEPRYGYHGGDVADLVETNMPLKNWIRRSRKDGAVVGFIGGPPCPDFSIGGKNKGVLGKNGRLTGVYFELIKLLSPDFFLFENVKGLWSTKKHRAFYEDMKETVHQSGYATTERLINSIEYGAPQDRDRIILIGFRKRLLADMNCKTNGARSLPEGLFKWDKHVRFPKERAFAYPWPKATPFHEDSRLPVNKALPLELTVEHWFKGNDVRNHENSVNFFKPRNGLARFLTVDEGDDSRKSFKRLHRWRYSPTACYGNNEVHLHPYKARRISVAEALAVQSLPKEFILPSHISLSNMFKMVGNGVPYLAAKALARAIREFVIR